MKRNIVLIVLLSLLCFGCEDKDTSPPDNGGGSSLGKVVYYISGKYIKEGGSDGKILYYISGKYIKEGGSDGKILYYISGKYIFEFKE